MASPEGVVETPLQLPKCKHVFGNKCILKWLRESFNCPYCRDKLESEPARPDPEIIRRMMANSELSFVPPNARRIPSRADRTQTSSTISTTPEARIEASGRARDHDVPTDANTPTTRGERRAAPSEGANEAQRRQRPRIADAYTGFGDTYSPHPSTASTQSPLREHPGQPQRTPAWGQNSQYFSQVPNYWSSFAHHHGGGLLPHETHQLPPVMAIPVHGPHYPGSPPDFHQSPTLANMQYMQVPTGTDRMTETGRFLGPLDPFHSWAPSPHSTTYGRQLPLPNDRQYTRSPALQSNHSSIGPYPGASSVSEQPRSPPRS